MKNKFISKSLILSLVVLFSCSNDEKSYDGSKITNYWWELSSFKLEQKVDLNLDGIESFEMLDEFECFSNERILFWTTTVEGNNFTFYESNLANYRTNGNGEEWFECVDINPSLSQKGSYKMLNENSIELNLKATPDKTVKKLQFEFIDNQLIQKTKMFFPVSYNYNSKTFVRKEIEVTKTYSKMQ